MNRSTLFLLFILGLILKIFRCQCVKVDNKSQKEKTIAFRVYRKNDFTSGNQLHRLRNLAPNAPLEFKNLSHYDTTLIYGNSSSINYYYVDVFIGNPPKKQTLIIDTGSGTTGIPCGSICKKCGTHLNSYYEPTKSSTAQFINCKTTDCSSRGGSCSDNETCKYAWSYGEGSSYYGVWIKDLVEFGDSFHSYDSVLLGLGCHTEETNLFYTQLADGIMGLSKGSNTNFVKMLYEARAITKNMFTLCFANDGGYFSTGGIQTHFHNPNDTIKYVPTISGRGFYTININSIKISGTSTLGVQAQLLDDQVLVPVNSNGFIDSGTTLSYFTSNLYKDFLDKFKNFCKEKGKCMNSKTLISSDNSYCFQIPSEIFKSKDFTEYYKTFPILTFTFGNGVEYTWLPKNYLYMSYEKEDVYCIGVISGGSNLLGGTWMHNHDIIFDTENERVGFISSHCSAKGYFLDSSHDAIQNITVTKFNTNTTTGKTYNENKVKNKDNSSGGFTSFFMILLAVLGGVGVYIWLKRRNNKQKVLSSISELTQRSDFM